MKCSNIPTMAELIAFLMHILEIHSLNAQLQAKCVWVGGHCMAVQRGVGQFGAHMICYCMIWCGETWGAAAWAQKLLNSYLCPMGFAEAWKWCRSIAKSPQTGAEWWVPWHPAPHEQPTPHGSNNPGLCQGLSWQCLGSVSLGRCSSAGAHADLREAANAEGEHQILSQSLTLCPTQGSAVR